MKNSPIPYTKVRVGVVEAASSFKRPKSNRDVPDGVERSCVSMGRRELLRGVVDGASVVRLAPTDQLHEALPVQTDMRHREAAKTRKQKKEDRQQGNNSVQGTPRSGTVGFFPKCTCCFDLIELCRGTLWRCRFAGSCRSKAYVGAAISRCVLGVGLISSRTGGSGGLGGVGRAAFGHRQKLTYIPTLADKRQDTDLSPLYLSPKCLCLLCSNTCVSLRASRTAHRPPQSRPRGSTGAPGNGKRGR